MATTRIKQKARRPGGTHEIADRPFTINLPQWVKPNSPTPDNTRSPAGVQSTDLPHAAEEFPKDAERCLFPGISPIEPKTARSSDGELTPIHQEIADKDIVVHSESTSGSHLRHQYGETRVEQPILYVPDSQAPHPTTSLSVGRKALSVSQLPSIGGHSDALVPANILPTAHTSEDAQRNEWMDLDRIERERTADQEYMERMEQLIDFKSDLLNDGESSESSNAIVGAAASEDESQTLTVDSPKAKRNEKHNITKKKVPGRVKYSSIDEEKEGRMHSKQRDRVKQRTKELAGESLSAHYSECELDDSKSKKGSQKNNSSTKRNTNANATTNSASKNKSSGTKDGSDDDENVSRMGVDSSAHPQVEQRNMKRAEESGFDREKLSNGIASVSSPKVKLALQKAKNATQKIKSSDKHDTAVKGKTKVAKNKKLVHHSGDDDPEIGMDVYESEHNSDEKRHMERSRSDSHLDELPETAAPSKSRKGPQKRKRNKRRVTSAKTKPTLAKKNSSRRTEDESSDEEKERRMDNECSELMQTSNNMERANEAPSECHSGSELDEPFPRVSSKSTKKGLQQTSKGIKRWDATANANSKVFKQKTLKMVGKDSSDEEERSTGFLQSKRSKVKPAVEEPWRETGKPTKTTRASGKETATKGKRKRSGKGDSDRDDKPDERKKALSPSKNYWQLPQRDESESKPRLRTRAEFRKQGMEPKVRMRWGGGTLVYDVEASR
ncbi:hypothetical protein BJ742DRAFT_735531 [Cladochytrium replicatum]|nr:hypothetical protein BJ742DRAFT_735531 [Cladochytrium replicatum]